MNKLFILLYILILNSSDCKSKEVNKIPKCIQEMIVKISTKEVANPPILIYSYIYNEQTVYYITSKCCDIPSNLYNQDCNRICSPDGGFTGKGDMKCTDFFKKRTEEKLVWKDERKFSEKKLNQH
jgi:hypothetical protein|tara:strand:- start:651 stop:1025 length:375 start_codon:yes stop_codon:yes gene_type:complete